jgi:hypothetical protein
LSSIAGGLGRVARQPQRGGSLGRARGLVHRARDRPADREKFQPIVIDYVRTHGGEDLVDKIRTALKL